LEEETGRWLNYLISINRSSLTDCTMEKVSGKANWIFCKPKFIINAFAKIIYNQLIKIALFLGCYRNHPSIYASILFSVVFIIIFINFKSLKNI
jgi:hypothetical protein